MAHNTTTASLKFLSRKIKAFQTKRGGASTTKDENSDEVELYSEVIGEVLQGMTVLSTLTSNVLFQSAFKYAYPYVEEEDQQEGTVTTPTPTEHHDNTNKATEHNAGTNTGAQVAPNTNAGGARKPVAKKPKIAEDVSVTPEVLPYALAVKYNYNNTDREILIDYIAMIKGLFSLGYS